VNEGGKGFITEKEYREGKQKIIEKKTGSR
jgi:hypothetical protein